MFCKDSPLNMPIFASLKMLLCMGISVSWNCFCIGTHTKIFSKIFSIFVSPKIFQCVPISWSLKMFHYTCNYLGFQRYPFLYSHSGAQTMLNCECLYQEIWTFFPVYRIISGFPNMPLSTCLHVSVKTHWSAYAYIRVSKIILYICPTMVSKEPLSICL